MRIVTEEAVARVLAVLPGVPRVVSAGNFAAPFVALGVLDRALERFRLNMLNAQEGVPDREGIALETSFVGPGMRPSPRLRYVPSRLSLVPRLFATALPPDVVLLHPSSPRDGTVSLGTEVNVLPAAIERVRERGGLVVAQLNPNMPYTHGDAVVPTDVVDYAIEVDERLSSPAVVEIDDAARRIGELVAQRVPDGATIQAGIGSVPDATLMGLTGRRGLRVWTEMFSDGLLAMERAGALDSSVPITSSFLFGSPELYAWVDGEPRVQMLRTEKVNNPALRGQPAHGQRQLRLAG